MEQGMSIRICRNRGIKSIEHKRVVIPVPDHECCNPAVIEVQNCTEMDFVLLCAFIPFEFGHIGKPFFIRLTGMKIAFKNDGKLHFNRIRIHNISIANINPHRNTGPVQISHD